MARYTTYKSGIVSGSNLIAASIATSNVFGTASYVLNVVSASFAKNASGSWLSSSFGTSLSALSAIGFGTDGKPLTVFPAQDSLYLTVVDGIIGWTTLDSAIYDSAITEDSLFTELGVYSQSLNYTDSAPFYLPELEFFTNNGVYSQSLNFANPNNVDSTEFYYYTHQIFTYVPTVFDYSPNNLFSVEITSQDFSTLSGSLANFIEITSYTTSSI
jgi:hypothetical protein